MTNPIVSIEDIAQTGILKKFAIFLKLKKRDSTIVEGMDESAGHCMGFTILALYALQLELTKPRTRTTKSRDDWTWMKGALERLARWDGTIESLNKKTKAAKKLRRDTERLISLIELFQNANNYLSGSQMRANQYLFEENGMPFFQEYTFGGIFSPDYFTKEIHVGSGKRKEGEEDRQTTLLKEIIKENRLVFVSCLNHVVGIFKFNHQYYFYDSNAKHGWTIYPENEEENLVKAFYSAHYTDIQKNLAINVNVFCRREDERVPYLAQDQLLAAIQPPACVVSESTDSVTALYMAADVGCRKSVKYYLAHPPIPLKEYVNKPCSGGDTPLIVAAKEGFTNIVTDLLNAGAEIDMVDDLKQTALYHAARNGYESTVRVLLKRGANPNIKNDSQFTPLYLAVSKSNYPLVALLLTYKADVNQASYLGYTAMHKAAENGNVHIAKLLVAHGATINALKPTDKSPFYKAVLYNHFDMAEFFLDLPGLQLTAHDYETLATTAKSHPQNSQIQRCLAKAQPLYMEMLIKQQLESMRAKQSFAYRKAIKIFTTTKDEIAKENLAEKNMMIFMLQKMLPLLGRTGWRQTQSIWKQTQLSDPLYKFAHSIDITPFDIANFNISSYGKRCGIV